MGRDYDRAVISIPPTRCEIRRVTVVAGSYGQYIADVVCDYIVKPQFSELYKARDMLRAIVQAARTAGQRLLGK